MLKGLVVGIVLGILLVFVGGYFYFASGQAPVATKSPEMLFEHKLARLALHAYLDRQPHPEPPITAMISPRETCTVTPPSASTPLG